MNGKPEGAKRRRVDPQKLEASLAVAIRAIVEYERHAGIPAEESAMGPLLSSSGDLVADILELGSKCAERLRFCRDVDRCLEGSKPMWQPVVVSRKTPASLLAVGFPDAPLHHTQKHVRREVSPKTESDGHAHGLPVQLLKRLPELLESPCAIWDNPRGKDGVLVMLDALDGDRLPLVAVLTPGDENKSTGERCNFVKTVYGMDQALFRLENAAKCRQLLWVDPDKTKRLMSSSSLQLLGSPISLEPILRQTRKTVNQEIAGEQGKRASKTGEPRVGKRGRQSGRSVSAPKGGSFSGRPPSEGRKAGREPAADRSRDCSPGRAWRSETRSKTH